MATDAIAPEVGRQRTIASEFQPIGLESPKSRLIVDPWVQLCQDFLRCHRQPLNVAIHLITTPLCFYGFLSLLALIHPGVAVGATMLYVIGLYFYVPRTTWAASTISCLALLALAVVATPTLVVSLILIAVGYVFQEASHWIAGEHTLQSTYQGNQGWISELARHTFLLIPLLIVVAVRRRQSPFRLLVPRKAVLKTKITDDVSLQGLDSIRSWVVSEHPTVDKSVHWWQDDLTDAAGEAFDALSHHPELLSLIRRFHGPGFEVQPVLGMNELYVTGPPKKATSDTVFYMPHVDGPYAVFPGASLYRCMLAVNQNAEVTTHYPMAGLRYDLPEGHQIQASEAVAFDFNRELHFITRAPNEAQTEPRMNLKLHFVAYPKAVPWYGSLLADLTTRYDIRARQLFLKTIDPNGFVAKIKTGWVLGWTKIFELVVRYVGWTNLIFVALMGLIAWQLGRVEWFLATTSFVHYGIYVGAFSEKRRVSFGTFIRNAVFFKTVSMISLATAYLLCFQGEWLSLAIVVMGFGVSMLATFALGLPRTYFSAELGLEPHKRIEQFPYGYIPHPMILGAIVALLGMLLVPSFASAFGWLIAGHVACYVCVLAQEMFDHHCGNARVENVDSSIDRESTSGLN